MMDRNPTNSPHDNRTSTMAGIGFTGFLLLITSLLTLASGCTGGPGQETMIVESLVDGAVRVTHTILPDNRLAIDTLAVWDLWQDDADYLFNSIAGVAGYDDGFYVCDRGNREIVHVDLHGNPLSHFGQSGEGPGELRFPHAIVRSGNELWIADIMNRRFSVYSTTGEYIRDTRWGSYAWHEFFPRDVSDLLIHTQTDVDFDNAGEFIPNHFILRANLATGSEDTLVTMPGLREQQIEVRASSGQAMIFVGPPQFAPRLHWAWSTENNRLHTVTRSDYHFEVRDLTGRLQREVIAPSPDLTVTQRDKDWFFNDQFQFGFGSGERFTATRTSLEKYPFAERRQAIEGLQTDPFGRIWVLANTEHPGTTRLDLFDPDGIYLGNLGEMPLPLTFTTDGSALIRIADDEDADIYLVISVLTTADGN
ncbi:hypothetical protein ACFL6T_05560 [Candidatus Zixiibacteriota bacterium]